MISEHKEPMGKDIIWNAVGTLFYMGCQWLLTVLVVRLNGDYFSAGILTLSMSISTPLITVATLGLRTYQVANMNERFSDGDFFGVRAITSIVSLVICAVIIAVSGYTTYTSWCVMLFVCYRLSEAIVDVLHGIDQCAWRLDIVGKSFLMRGSIMLVAFVIGELLFRSLLLSIILMGVGVYGVILCYDVPSCKKCTQLNLSLDHRNLLPLIGIGVPLGAFTFLVNLMPSIPRFFMERLYGEDVLGVFGSITTITMLIPQLASFIFGPLVPVFAEYWKAHDIKHFNKLFAMCIFAIALIGGVTLVCGYFWGEWGLSLILGDSIRPYSYLLCPVIGTAIITAYISLLGATLIVLGDYSALVWLSTVSVFVTLAASVLLIQRDAFMGTILATAIGLSIELVLLGARTVITILKRN